jgi:organic anion transporter 3A
MPSKISGAIVSTFELGNLLTIIFVSYFGTHRHIPHWIGKGIVITGIGSLVFAIPHFMDINNPLGYYYK